MPLKKLLLLLSFLTLIIFFAYKNLNQGVQDQAILDFTPKIFFTPINYNFFKTTVNIGLGCEDKSTYPLCYKAKIDRKNLKRIRIFHNGYFGKEADIIT